MADFPCFFDLTEKEVLLIGGDRQILEKLQRLQPFQAHLVVLCKTPMPEVATFPGAVLERRDWRQEDLDRDPVMVIVSAEDTADAERISHVCRKRKIPVNVVDVPRLCSFYFPALITQGDLTVGISTAGVSPAAAAVLKDRIRERIPSRAAEIIRWVRQQRDRLPHFSGKRRYLRRITEEAMEKNRPLTEEELATDVHFST